MGGRYVGIDLHRRGSVIYTMDADSERLDCVRVANDPWRLLEEVARAGGDAEVVIEATYGWYWAVDLLRVASSTGTPKLFVAPPRSGERRTADMARWPPDLKRRRSCL
jgi:hypothetical protein